MAKQKRQTSPHTTRSAPLQQGTITYHKPIASMTPDEARTWIQGIRDRLLSKMHRERAYLDRRAARGTHTPTDETYEQDQHVEAELLGLLDELEQGLN
jgi:hypothetical protein